MVAIDPNGTGWVHDADVGWVYKRGDGYFYSQATGEWVHRPDLLDPDFVPPPPPVPPQQRAAEWGRAASTRLTNGLVLPLEPTKPHRFVPTLLLRWARRPLFWVLAVWCAIPTVQINVLGMSNDDPQVAVFLFPIVWAIVGGVFYFWVQAARGRNAVGKAGRHAVQRTRQQFVRNGDWLHAHGWPSWTDAWGTKGFRPGGAFRGALRGLVRLYMYVVLPILVLSTGAGGDAFAGVLVMAVLLGVPTLLAVGWLYQFRCTDFDPVKGVTFSVAFYLMLRATIFRDAYVTDRRSSSGGAMPPWA